MWKDLFAGRDWVDLPTVGLLLFMAFFVLMVAWVFRRGGRPHYDRVSQLPLDNRSPDEVAAANRRTAGEDRR